MNADGYRKAAGITQKYEAVDVHWPSLFSEDYQQAYFFLDGRVRGGLCGCGS